MAIDRVIAADKWGQKSFKVVQSGLAFILAVHPLSAIKFWQANFVWLGVSFIRSHLRAKAKDFIG